MISRYGSQPLTQRLFGYAARSRQSLKPMSRKMRESSRRAQRRSAEGIQRAPAIRSSEMARLRRQARTCAPAPRRTRQRSSSKVTSRTGMEPVFNRPMVSAQGEQALGICFFGFQAGETINGFGAEPLGDQIGGVAPDREDLSHMGKVQVIVQLGAGPDAADFQTAVTFIGRGVLRGGKTPSSGRRYLDGA